MYDAGLKYVSVVSYTKEICRLGAIYVPRFVSFQESSQCTLGQTFIDIGHEETLLNNLLLMSNKNLSFLQFKHPIGGGQLPKNVCKIL